MSEITWRTTDLSLARIERILGRDYVEGILRLSPSAALARAQTRAAGAWDANDRERYAAYRSLERHLHSRRDPARKSGYAIRSGRRLLGTVRPTDTRDVFAWSSNFTKDHGVTAGLDNAIRLVIREAGMSLRQHEIDLVDVTTGKRRSLNPERRDPKRPARGRKMKRS